MVGFSWNWKKAPFLSITLLLRVVPMELLILSLACVVPLAHLEASSGKPVFVRETPHSTYNFVNSIGINTHLNYFDRIYGNFQLVEQDLKSIGILHVRDGIHLQNQDYNETLYKRWIQLGKLGIRFDAVLDPRSNLGAINSALLEKIDVLAGHTIESFEGPNELDVSNLPDWPSVDRNYQKDIFTAVRSMSAGSRIGVIGPSMAFAANGKRIGNISEWIDQGNLHPYPAGEMPSVVFPEQIDLANIMCDKKQIVFTESGYHNAVNDPSGQPGISEKAAAKYIPRLFLEDFAHGVPRTYLYELMDEAPDPGLTNAQLHWGLIRANGSAKPAFFALKNLISELYDPKQNEHLRPFSWMLNRNDPHIHHLLLQKSTGEYDLVFWQEISSYDVKRHTDIENPSVASVLTLARRARSIAVYDPVRQTEPIEVYTNEKSVLLQIPDQPLVVEIKF